MFIINFAFSLLIVKRFQRAETFRHWLHHPKYITQFCTKDLWKFNEKALCYRVGRKIMRLWRRKHPLCKPEAPKLLAQKCTNWHTLNIPRRSDNIWGRPRHRDVTAVNRLTLTDAINPSKSKCVWLSNSSDIFKLAELDWFLSADWKLWIPNLLLIWQSTFAPRLFPKARFSLRALVLTTPASI